MLQLQLEYPQKYSKVKKIFQKENIQSIKKNFLQYKKSREKKRTTSEAKVYRRDF